MRVQAYECAAVQAGFVLVPPGLRDECVVEVAACWVAGPAFGELGVERAEFAHDSGRACVAGDAQGFQAETGCPCRVGLGGTGDGDGELGREVTAVTAAASLAAGIPSTPATRSLVSTPATSNCSSPR
jgi:hypothetical protein